MEFLVRSRLIILHTNVMSRCLKTLCFMQCNIIYNCKHMFYAKTCIGDD